MMFRTVLLVLLTLALNVAAIAHCRVGGMSMNVADAGELQSGTHDHKADCEKPEKRVCDAMVQLTAPDQPSAAPSLVRSAFASVVFATSIEKTPAIAPSLRQWHPPPDGRSSTFKTVYARTGRLLV
jgi:hypothetical protein